MNLFPKSLQHTLLLCAALRLVDAVAIPDPTAAPAKVEARAPQVTPAAIVFNGDRSYQLDERGLFDDITSGVGNLVDSWGSILGTAVPSFFTDGLC